MGNLHFTATIDAAKFNKTLDDIEKRIKGIQDNSTQGNPFFNLSNLADGYAVIQTLGDIASNIVKVRGEFQQLDITFTSLLKSKAAANDLMQEVIKMAAGSPFELTEIADGAKQLLIFGANAKTAVDDMKMLGDIAVGTATPVNELAAAYGSLRQKGEASDGELQQFASKGIPIYAELAKILNTSTDKVKYFADAGKVGFNEMQQAFTNMTSQGGMFEGLMDQQSKTLQGSIAQLNNAFSNMFNGIIQDQEGFLSGAVSATTDLVNNYETVIDVLKVLVAMYGTYKAAVILAAAAQKLAALATFIREYYEMANALGIATAHQIAFNGAVAANPYVLAAVALAGLIGYLVIFNDELTDAEKAQQKLNEATQKTEKELTGEIAKIQVLTAQIEDETLSREARNKALNDLIAISPEHLSALTLENTATADGVKAINGYIEAKRKQLELKNLEAELEESLQRELDAKNNKNDLGWFEKAGLALVYQNQAGLKIAEKTIELNGEIAKSEKVIQTAIMNKISLRTKEASEAEKASQQKGNAAKKTIDDYNKEIQLNESLREQYSTDRKAALQYEREINKLKRQRAALTGENEIKEPFGSLAYWETIAKNAGDFLRKINPLAPNSAKEIEKAQNKRLEAEFKIADLRLELDKNYADGSIESYERIAQSAATMLTKINPEDKSVGDLLKIQLEAQQKAENLRKALTIKTTDEEIEEKKKQFELYNLWLKHAGKEAADEQFKNLKDSGAGFKEYLEKNINTIQGRVNDKTATSLDLENLVKYKVAFESINQNIDDYKQKITSAGQAVGSLTEYLKLLKEEQAKLGKNDDGKKGFLAEQITETEKKRIELLKSFFIENNIGEEKRLGIQKKYDDLRTELDREYADKKSRIYQEALNKINLQEQNELNEADGYFKDIVEKTQKELSAIIEKKSSKKLKQFIDAAYTDLTEMQMAGKTGTEAYKQMEKAIDDANKKLKELDNASMKEMISIVEQTGSQLKGLGGKLGEIGGILEDLGHQAQSVFATIEKAKDPGFEPGIKDYASAIQGVVNMISIVIESNKKRAEQEKKFAQERIGYENQYQLALNKGIGDSYKKDGNIFIDDTEAKIKAGAKQLQDAQRTYQDAINKLNSGWAKDHQKDVIDGKTVGKLVGQGAAAGAIIGTIIPGVGNAIGAAVGAVVGAVVGGVAGLFTKKKKDVFGGLLELYPSLVETGADGWKEINVEMAKALLANDQLDEGTKQLVQTALDYGEAVNQSTEQMKEGILELVGKLGDTIRDSLVNAFKAGEDAAMAFSRTVGNVIADMAAKLLFTALFKENFDKLEKEMIESYGLTGDQSIVDDLSRFTKDAEGKPKKFVEDLQSISEALEGMGFQDAFGKKGASGSNSLSGSIKSVTEETAGVLAGQLNAIRINQATNLEVNRSQLLSLTKIANNSEYLKHLELLKSIDKKLSTSNDLRAGGIDG